MLVLGTYRDSELSQSHPLLDTLAALRRHSGVTRIELTGLDDTGVVSFMEAAAGHTLDDAGVGLAHAVYRETDGNPFFVSEVLRHLSETGAIYQDATGRWTADDSLEQMALPDSVREVIGGRVGTTRRRRRTHAVAWRRSSAGTSTSISWPERRRPPRTSCSTSSTPPPPLSLVRELADTGHYNFAHALIQHTLYEDLGPTRRARAHRQVAEALEDLCGDRPGTRVGELARHWISATQPIDLTKAISYSRQAGDAALSALAPADALRYYAQALDLYPQATDPDPVLGIDLAIGLGTAQRQTGDPAFRDTLLGAARRAADLGDTDRLVAAALANDRGFCTAVGVIDADKVESLGDGPRSASSGQPRPGARARHPVFGTRRIGSPLERRQALADEALAIAQSSGDDATIVRVLNHVFYPLQVPSQCDQSLAWTADALVRAERVGDPVLLFWAAYCRDIGFCRGRGHRRDGPLLRDHRVDGRTARPADLELGATVTSPARAQIAGDTDRPNSWPPRPSRSAPTAANPTPPPSSAHSS